MIKDQFYSFFDAQKLVDQFEQVLNNNGIEITPGSELERLCLNITDLVEKHLNPRLREENHDHRPYFRECLGLNDLITKIVKSSSHPNFQSLLPYLKKLNDNNPIQNTQTSVLNQYNNKLFELYISTLCLNMNGANLSIDDPDHSVGDNPDILVKIDGKVWGFACKTLHSRQPMTIFENIEKAVSQIECSNADIGIPIINIKNIIDHDTYWPDLTENGASEKYFGAFIDVSVPLKMLQDFCAEIHKDVVDHVGHKNIQYTFDGKKSFPLALLYCSSATSVAINNQPHPTRLNCFNLLAFGDADNCCLKVCERLNHELQVIEYT